MTLRAVREIHRYKVHKRILTQDHISDAFMMTKCLLQECGWDQNSFAMLFEISEKEWLDYTKQKRISADMLDKMRKEAALEKLRHSAANEVTARIRLTVKRYFSTSSGLHALYKAAFDDESFIHVPHDKNPNITAHERDIVKWFRAARYASREQLMKATGLEEYDVGRIGYRDYWAIPLRKIWVENLETLTNITTENLTIIHLPKPKNTSLVSRILSKFNKEQKENTMKAIPPTPEEIREHFIEVRRQLKKRGWTTEDFCTLLGISKTEWHRFGHKLESKSYRQIPAIMLDKLRQEAAVEIASLVDRTHDPFGRDRDEWTVGDLTTKSSTLALYRSALSGEEIMPAAHNSKFSEFNLEDELTIRWFRAARFASYEQMVNATGLNKYDVGRIGYQVSWGIPTQSHWPKNLEKLTR